MLCTVMRTLAEIGHEIVVSINHGEEKKNFFLSVFYRYKNSVECPRNRCLARDTLRKIVRPRTNGKNAAE